MRGRGPLPARRHERDVPLVPWDPTQEHSTRGRSAPLADVQVKATPGNVAQRGRPGGARPVPVVQGLRGRLPDGRGRRDLQGGVPPPPLSAPPATARRLSPWAHPALGVGRDPHAQRDQRRAPGARPGHPRAQGRWHHHEAAAAAINSLLPALERGAVPNVATGRTPPSWSGRTPSPMRSTRRSAATSSPCSMQRASGWPSRRAGAAAADRCTTAGCWGWPAAG